MALLLLVAACTRTPTPTGVFDDPSLPDIDVSPASVAFTGTLGGDVLAETVTVRNRGTAALEITDLSWEEPAEGFVVSSIGAVLLPPDGATTFVVTWEPSEEALSGTLLIGSNDPGTPVFALPVTATLESEGVVATPESLTFGDVPVGCSSTQVLTLENRGLVDVTVLQLAYTAATDELTFDPNEAANGAVPFVIPAGESRQVSVAYQPADEVADEGFLEILTDDPLHPTSLLYQIGDGVYGEWGVDTYARPDPMPVDVLFVLDDSSSSADEHILLEAAFPTFLTALEDQDYAIGVIDMANPNYRGEPILPDTEDPTYEFASQTPGSSGSGPRLGLANLYSSITAADALDARREEGLFTVIFVSDDADDSPEAWTTYWEALDTFGPHPGDTVFHAISGDTMGGCGTAWPDNAAYELTVASGGAYLGECVADYWAHMTRLAAAAIPDPTRFPLSGLPMVETLTVSVDGLGTTGGWSYDSGTNTVIFEERALPGGDAVVELRYAPMPECE
jgi:hypothetical protein